MGSFDNSHQNIKTGIFKKVRSRANIRRNSKIGVVK